jgi:hypothetical protein
VAPALAGEHRPPVGEVQVLSGVPNGGRAAPCSGARPAPDRQAGTGAPRKAVRPDHRGRRSTGHGAPGAPDGAHRPRRGSPAGAYRPEPGGDREGTSRRGRGDRAVRARRHPAADQGRACAPERRPIRPGPCDRHAPGRDHRAEVEQVRPRHKTLRITRQLQRQTWEHGCNDPHACGSKYHKTKSCRRAASGTPAPAHHRARRTARATLAGARVHAAAASSMRR